MFAGSEGAATGLEIALKGDAQSYPVQRHISPGDVANAAKMLRTTKPRTIPIVPRWRCKVWLPGQAPVVGAVQRDQLTRDRTLLRARLLAPGPAVLVAGGAVREFCARPSLLARRNTSKY